MRALIVDDARSMRWAISSMLASRGVSCVVAADGREGLEALRGQGPFEFALVDWNMPVMDGLELLKAARRDSAFAGVKILMVTTQGDCRSIETALSEGANEYLLKPFDEAGLWDKLALAGLVVG